MFFVWNGEGEARVREKVGDVGFILWAEEDGTEKRIEMGAGTPSLRVTVLLHKCHTKSVLFSPL